MHEMTEFLPTCTDLVSWIDTGTKGSEENKQFTD